MMQDQQQVEEQKNPANNGAEGGAGQVNVGGSTVTLRRTTHLMPMPNAAPNNDDVDMNADVTGLPTEELAEQQTALLAMVERYRAELARR